MTFLSSLLTRLTEAQVANPVADTSRDKSLLANITADTNIPNPFSDLPNIKRAWIRANVLDPLLNRYGIEKKFEPSFEFEGLSFRIRVANRYIRIMHFRLVKMLKQRNHIGFWKLALEYMQKSKVLRVIALRQLERNWHIKFSFGFVKELLRKLDAHINEQTISLNLKQHYVPKVKADGSKSWRPIGSPSRSTRMYLYLWQSFFMIYVYCYISPHAHGYIPKRGVLTAWKDITRNIHRKYIWEFDLEGAFPSVSIPAVCDRLVELGMPSDVVDIIFNMSVATVPKLNKEEQKLPEPKIEKQLLLKNAPPLYTSTVKWFSLMAYGPPPKDAFLGLTIEVIQDGRKAYKAWTTDQKSFVWGMMKVYNMPFSLENLRSVARVVVDHPEFPLRKPFITFDFDEAVGFKYEKALRKARKELTTFTAPVAPKTEPTPTPASSPDPLPEFKHPLLMLHHARMLILKQQPPSVKVFDKLIHQFNTRIELRGFPQGSGLSPILFAFAFEDSIVRRQFKADHPNAHVISYADDFLVFSDHPLMNIMHMGKAMVHSGLRFSLEKSRQIRSGGEWLVDKFKFLGLTYKPKSAILLGTPRSGKELVYDKAEAMREFVLRDAELARFTKYFKLPDSPQEVLNKWGEKETPYSLIPVPVISGQSPLTDSLLKRIAMAYHSILKVSADLDLHASRRTEKSTRDLSPVDASTAPSDRMESTASFDLEAGGQFEPRTGENYDELRQTKFPPLPEEEDTAAADLDANPPSLDDIDQALKLDDIVNQSFGGSVEFDGGPSSSEADLLNRYAQFGKALGFTAVRRAGLIISRLHSGKWAADKGLVSQFTPLDVYLQSGNDYSWYALRNNTLGRTSHWYAKLTLENSTTVATSDLLRMLSNRKFIRINRQSQALKYRFKGIR